MTKDDILIVALSIVFVAGVAFMIWAYLSKFSHNTWFCEKMGWHLTPKAQGFDGCSFTGICPRCDRNVMQDSQGNWF